jgi:hypothetical protein
MFSASAGSFSPWRRPISHFLLGISTDMPSQKTFIVLAKPRNNHADNYSVFIALSPKTVVIALVA